MRRRGPELRLSPARTGPCRPPRPAIRPAAARSRGSPCCSDVRGGRSSGRAAPAVAARPRRNRSNPPGYTSQTPSRTEIVRVVTFSKKRRSCETRITVPSNDQRLFEDLGGGDVEVVGRLVEKEQVARLEEQLGRARAASARRPRNPRRGAAGRRRRSESARGTGARRRR